MNLGIDFHDTLTYHPQFFLNLCKSWVGTGLVYIITGTPESGRASVVSRLNDLGFSQIYTALLMGYEYEKNDMTTDHFKHMREHKIALLKKYDISVYFDDNPFYVDYARRNGILAFQPILSQEYIDEFGKKDPYFTCHLQQHQFDFIESLDNIRK